MPLRKALQRLTGADDAFLHKSVLQWVLPFCAALLPIVLLGTLSDRMATQAVERLLLSQQLTLASNVARDVTRLTLETTTLATAVASLPKTVEAVEAGDRFALQSRMKALVVAEQALEAAATYSATGALLGAFPVGNAAAASAVFPDTGVDVTVLPGGRAVGVVAPVRSASGATLAHVVLTWKQEALGAMLESLDLPPGGSLALLDADTRVVAHTGTAATLLPLRYGDAAALRRVAAGDTVTVRTDDPVSHRPSTVTLVPVSVGKRMWVVAAGQETAAATADLRRLRAGLVAAGVTLTLVTLAMVVWLARMQVRNIRLNRTLDAANQDLREVAAIVDASNDPIIGLTDSGVIRTWNAAAERLYGRTELAVVGRALAEFLPADRREEFDGWLREVLQGNTVAQRETVRLRADGSPVPVAVTLSPVRDAQGRIGAVACIDRDITAQKEIEQMKDDFISFVSHQLKAPVTATRWTIEGILDGDYGPVTEELKEPLHQLHDVTTQNFALISEILNVSRIDRGVIELQRAPAQLRDVAERAMRDYRIAAQKAGLSLTVEGGDQDILVDVDLEKMAEAVTNAISNAIKHTKTGGITLRLSRDGRFGVVDVADTGEGMPPAMLAKLFTRTGVKGANTQAAGSSGLGLYIAKHFMELQGGDVSVTSEVGKGSVFRYRIPLAAAPHGG